MKYSEMESIDSGLKFKTIGGVLVETTGQSEFIESVNVHVHNAVILDGIGQGNHYLHNLDSAELLQK